MCYVLIVNDSEQSNKKIQEIIAKHFINVILLPVAKNEATALKLSQEHFVEIAIITVDVPTIDCFKLIKKLREKSPNLKVILISKTKDFTKVQRPLRYGVIDYLIKPLDDSLILSLDRAIKSIYQVSLYNEEIAKRKIEDPSANIHVKKMFTYIHENFQNNMTLTSLANHLNFNQQYTSKFFKKHVGINFVTYLIYLRIEKAKKLLSTSQLPIIDISHAIGYPEATYFTKLFKKHTGHTPQNYRTLFKGERSTLHPEHRP